MNERFRQSSGQDAFTDAAGEPAGGSDAALEAPTPDSPLFHFARPEDWQAAQASGEYLPGEFAREGFIHCATEVQIAGVVERHLRGQGPRIRLQLDPAALREHLQFEWSTASHDLYPHLFAPIPLSAVIDAVPFDPDGD